MKTLIFTILLVPILAQAQTFKRSVFMGTNLTFYSSNSKEVLNPDKGKEFFSLKYSRIGFYGGYSIEYSFPRTLILGASLEYFNTKAIFNTNCYCPSFYIPEYITVHRNTVFTHNIGLPLYFKLRTNRRNYTYVHVGLGINWLFFAHRKVEVESTYMGVSPPIITRREITKEAFTLKNANNGRFGTFFYLGVGQLFRIRKLDFFAELSYRQDINSWIYETVETPIGIRKFPIIRYGINLKTGIFLNGKGETKK